MRELVFYQLPKGYRYNSTSIIFYDFLKDLNLKNKVLEVGAGCGIIGILLKENNKNLELFLMDILKLNCEICELNLKKNDIKAQILNEDFVNFRAKEQFDFIFSNPPFYREDAVKSKHFQSFLSKSSTNLPLEKLIASASLNLKSGGKFIFCYESFKIDEIIILLSKYKLKLSKIRFIHKDEKSSSKLVFIVAVKNGKSMCEVLAPRLLYEKGEMSAYLRRVYEGIKLQSKDFDKGLKD